MIYFYYGTDIKKNRDKAHDLIDSLQKKKPDASFFQINSENFDSSKLQEYIGGQGLFSNKYIVFLDRLSEKKEIKDLFVESIKEVAGSNNIFIILEGKIDKATSTKIEKKAEKSIKSDLIEKEGKVDSRIFEIANVFDRKNKKELWLVYRELIENGNSPEEIHGVLFWKVKTMLLSDYYRSWKKEELIVMLDKLVSVYHESRRGLHELETGLESLILKLN